MRFQGVCYRAHDPRWSFKPTSGAGAAIYGGRFNPRGVEALYLSLSASTAIKEANQGFSHKIEPCVLCSYDVDSVDIADLRSDEKRAALSVELADMSCGWFVDAAAGVEPASWRIARTLATAGWAEILTPSFAPGAADDDHNLVLWKWGARLPHKVDVFDPSGRLPKNQLSWD